jgi:hypothetical protein
MPLDARSVAARRILADVTGPPRFLSAALSAAPGVRHGFFGREGGVSAGVFASLNTGPGSGDDPAAVGENRARIAAALGVAPDRLVSAYQIHSPICVRVAGPFASDRPQADAMVAATPGVALGVLTADCAPVLFVDATARVIGAAHAGWKGAVGGVLESCIAQMQALGAAPARIVAAIGPSIRQPSYEVGPDFKAAVLAQDAAGAPFFRAGQADRLHFDLPGFCVMRLERLGLGRIDALPFDTYSEETALFSYRRATHAGEKDYGRNLSAIVLAEED